MDQKDQLGEFRKYFFIPKNKQGENCIYLAGNSLGLQPKGVQDNIDQELKDWAQLGVEGHFHAKNPWLPYHESVTAAMARVVGAKPQEVVVMNSLTVNLHLMMVSFYRPSKKRFKVLIEKGAFPSDQYAVASQIRFHGLDPKETLIEVGPRENEDLLRTEDLLSAIEKHGSELALVLLGQVNYLTGQAYDVPTLVQATHNQGSFFALDLAHGAGNLLLSLHDWNVDFAVWCSYKYLNSGPGGIAGCFVHEKHKNEKDIPRFAGWWGHNKKTRFQMGPDFDLIEGAEGWQLSNPPIFQLASLRASLDLFDRATMPELRRKGDQLTGYLQDLLEKFLGDSCEIVTPKLSSQRGSQLSLRVQNPKERLKKLADAGIICDFREPDIIRAAPVPLYNTFHDIWSFVQNLKND